MEVLPISDAQVDDISDDDSDGDDLMLLASTRDPPSSAVKKHTIRLQGAVGKHQILILIDSGSVSSFISTNLAQRLECATQPMPPRQFTVADGHPVHCTSFVPNFEWGVQGHTFNHSVHVLNLGFYDMILGADWLDLHSPMWVHWRKKVMRFTHNKRRITLRGVQTRQTSCKRVTMHKLKGLLKKGSVSEIVVLKSVHDDNANVSVLAQNSETDEHTVPGPALQPDIQNLVQEFSHLFKEPSELPPKRAQDHTIPLLPGAQPVKVRPLPLHSTTER